MKKFYKFFFVLLSLVVGGVGAPVSVNAKQVIYNRDNTTYEIVREIEINVWRKARVFSNSNSNYDNEFPMINLDLANVKNALGLKDDAEFSYDNIRVVDSDGNFIKTITTVDDNGTYGNKTIADCDGWLTEDGKLVYWGFGHNVCVKFYLAITNGGTCEICDVSTRTDSRDYLVKYALVNGENAVVYNIKVHFYTNTESFTHTLYSTTTSITPKLWESYGKDGMIQMYMGGWKYQTGSELAGKYTATSLKYTDNSGSKNSNSWETAEQDNDYVNKDESTENGNKDYFQYFFPNYRYKSFAQGDNARSEFTEPKKDGKAGNVPGKYDRNLGIRGELFKGNPFTVPCFGAFLKFEPEQNGVVDLYIIQNGLIDLSEKGADGKKLLKQSLSWRPVYIVDELGNQLTDDKDGVTAELPRTYGADITETTIKSGQKIYIGWDGSYDDKMPGTTGYFLPNMADVSRVGGFLNAVSDLQENVEKKTSAAVWEKLTGYTKDAKNMNDTDKKVYANPYWTTGGTEMRMMPPSDSQDGWIAINKTYVKYTFPVKAGKSYYVFSNDSQIGYCGYEFIQEGALQKGITITDEDYTSQPGSYESVTVKRSFKPGWNAICLPFSVTESKMREWFGSNGNKEDYELVTYNGCAKTKEGENGTTKDGSLTAYFFRHAYQDILAGYPYMIYIPYGAKALDSQKNGYVKFSKITIEDNVEMATFSNSTEYMDNSTNSTINDIAKEDAFRFEGTFVPMTVPAGSYVVYGIGSHPNASDEKYKNSTGIRYVASATPMNGLRSYLRPSYLDKNPTAEAVARIVGTNFSDVIDDSNWDDATVINGLMEEMGLFDQRENVYSVTGQLVRQNTTSLVGLPKGVYIVKGKKYFVK